MASFNRRGRETKGKKTDGLGLWLHGFDIKCQRALDGNGKASPRHDSKMEDGYPGVYPGDSGTSRGLVDGSFELPAASFST